MLNSLKKYCVLLGALWFVSNLVAASESPELSEYRYDAVYDLVTLDWSPYVVVNNGRISGYDVDVVKAAFGAVNVDVDVSVLPWSRALLSSELGRYVALFPEYYDEMRTEKFIYSDSYSGGKLYLFKLTSNDFTLPKGTVFKTVSDFKILESQVIGVVRGYVNTPEFDESTHFKKIEAVNDTHLIELLHKKRVDLIVMDEKVMINLKKRHAPEYDGIEKIPNLISYNQHYLGFSKANYLAKQALADFNKGLKIIRANGTLRKLIKKYKMN